MFGFRGVFARKPRQFDYRPRYYDADKDAREQRRKEILGYRDSDFPEGEEYVPGKYIKREMMYRRGLGQTGKANTVNKPLRLVILLVLLGIAVWWVLS